MFLDNIFGADLAHMLLASKYYKIFLGFISKYA